MFPEEVALGCQASAIIYQNTRVYGDYQLINAINASARQLPNATSSKYPEKQTFFKAQKEQAMSMKKSLTKAVLFRDHSKTFQGSRNMFHAWFSFSNQPRFSDADWQTQSVKQKFPIGDVKD